MRKVTCLQLSSIGLCASVGNAASSCRPQYRPCPPGNSRPKPRRPRSTAGSTSKCGKPSSRTPRSSSRIRSKASPHRRKPKFGCSSATGTVYIGIICFDSDPSKIIVSQARRDATLTDTDSIILVFDTFNDSQNAFVFGTNPLGHRIRRPGGRRRSDRRHHVRQWRRGQADRSVAGSAPSTPTGTATGRCKSAITERGWEAELAIPLKTLRYETGSDRTWGFNVMRNIRRKNEQVYLAAIPRGFDIYRVSLAAKLTNLDLPGAPRHQADSLRARRRRTRTTAAAQSARSERRRRSRREVGNPAQPDDGLHGQHRLRAGRGRRGAGQPHALRSVLPREAAVLPRERVDISVRQSAADRSVFLAPDRSVRVSAPRACRSTSIGGTRLSGKVGAWNVGLLDIQTGGADDASGRLDRPRQQLRRACVCSAKSVGRASAASSSTARAQARARETITGTAPTASTPTLRCRQTRGSLRSSRGRPRPGDGRHRHGGADVLRLPQ